MKSLEASKLESLLNNALPIEQLLIGDLIAIESTKELYIVIGKSDWVVRGPRPAFVSVYFLHYSKKGLWIGKTQYYKDDVKYGVVAQVNDK